MPPQQSRCTPLRSCSNRAYSTWIWPPDTSVPRPGDAVETERKMMLLAFVPIALITPPSATSAVLGWNSTITPGLMVSVAPVRTRTSQVSV